MELNKIVDTIQEKLGKEESGRIEVIIEALQRTNLLESNYSFLRFLKKNRAEIDKLFKTVEKDMEVN